MYDYIIYIHFVIYFSLCSKHHRGRLTWKKL